LNLRIKQYGSAKAYSLDSIYLKLLNFKKLTVQNQFEEKYRKTVACCNDDWVSNGPGILKLM